MATARISQAPPPHVDPVKATLAFGIRAVPRLKRELDATGNELVVVQRALMSLTDVLRNPNNTAEAVTEGVLSALGKLLAHDDSVVREKATECLHHFSAAAVGRDAIVAEELIPKIAERYEDSVAIVRLNAHTCIERVSKFEEGAAGVVDGNLVPKLVQLLPSEVEDEIQATILDTLHNTLKGHPTASLDAGAIPVFTALLAKSSSEIVYRAARNLMGITVPLAGKNAACEQGVIKTLVTLLGPASERTPDVISSACAALMSIVITTEGKLKAVEDGITENLSSLLNHTDERVLLNAIKLITVIAEAPKARSNLQVAVPRLRELKDYRGDRLDVMAVSRSATTAVDTITWRP